MKKHPYVKFSPEIQHDPVPMLTKLYIERITKEAQIYFWVEDITYDHFCKYRAMIDTDYPNTPMYWESLTSLIK